MSALSIVRPYVKQLDFSNPDLQKAIQGFINEVIACQYGEIQGWSMSERLMDLNSQPFLTCDIYDIPEDTRG